MLNHKAKVSKTGHTPILSLINLASVQVLPHTKRHQRSSIHAEKQGDGNMLGIIAAVLIVLWLLGFFAFHVTSSFIHVVLVVGIIMLVVHFMRRNPASV